MECPIIKKKQRLMLAIIALLPVLMLHSCYYDNEEELYPGAGSNCDTMQVTYTATVAPILDQYCNACHKAGSNNIVTDNYTTLKIIADDGRLWGVVNHETGFSPMPKNAAKLSSCDLLKIRKWLNDGALNN